MTGLVTDLIKLSVGRYVQTNVVRVMEIGETECVST